MAGKGIRLACRQPGISDTRTTVRCRSQRFLPRAWAIHSRAFITARHGDLPKGRAASVVRVLDLMHFQVIIQ
jgi:hypothetical protein